MTPPPPIDTGPLLLPLHQELITLLRGLPSTAWDLPTEAPTWTVRRVVAHLVDTMLRRLSLHRDGHQPPPSDDGPLESLQSYLDRLNADWIRATDRLGPGVLVSLLQRFGPEQAAFLAGLPFDGPALWPVAWAGESASANWMDVGREYTERWHHQQQIRSAVGSALLTEPRWLTPMIALGIRALPLAFEAINAPIGTAVAIDVTGPAGGRWIVYRAADGWQITIDPRVVTTTVTLSEDLAWRTWYSGRRHRPSISALSVVGDPTMAEPVLSARALMV